MPYMSASGVFVFLAAVFTGLIPPDLVNVCEAHRWLWIYYPRPPSGTPGKCPGDGFEHLTAETTVKSFSSPNYPNKYASNLNCTWLLEAPDDHYIWLEAERIQLEKGESGTCKYDHLIIYDGPSTSSPSFGGKMCGEGSFSNHSSGRYLTVSLLTDRNEERSGFTFKYMAVHTNQSITGLWEIPTTTPSTLMPTTTTSTTSKWKMIVATTTATTTTTEASQNSKWLNTGALIGGVIGGICFIIIMGVLCGRCLGRGEPRQPPDHRAAAFYHSHAPPEADRPTPAAVHMVQNNNAVFMVHQATGGAVSPSHLASFSSDMAGVANVAFSSSVDRLNQFNASFRSSYGFLSPHPTGLPPPVYTDSMLITHPPRIAPTKRPPSPTNETELANDDASHQPDQARPAFSTQGGVDPVGVTNQTNATRDSVRDGVVGNAANTTREGVHTDSIDNSTVNTDGTQNRPLNPDGTPVIVALVSSTGGPAMAHALTPLNLSRASSPVDPSLRENGNPFEQQPSPNQPSDQQHQPAAPEVQTSSE